MRLNHDCIRDILLYIEDNTESVSIVIDFCDLCSHLNYEQTILDYHIRKLDQANLFDDVAYSDDTIEYISSLSWNGHNYASNVRDPKVWNGIKKSLGTISSVSLPILMKYSSDYLIKLLGS